MTIDSRFYGGSSLRPRPDVFIDENQSLYIVATPWGSPETAETATQVITDYFSNAQDDLEVTSPFPLQTCLTPTENYLRVATLLANQAIYREINQDEYYGGIELFAMHYTERECAIVQVGHPSCLLLRKGQGIIPLGVQMDLSLVAGSQTQTSPLPSNLLGIDPTANIDVKSFTPNPSDRLLLISRSLLPSRLFQLSEDELSLERITEVLAQDNEAEPFWISLITFPGEAE